MSVGVGEMLAPNVRLFCGDCREVLPLLGDVAPFEACVTDPPYGLGFMGKDWDGATPGAEVWGLVLQALRPGAHLLAFAGTRTQHRMACAIEDAGFEIRDMIAWLYGSGFPKSHNLDGEFAGWGTTLKPALEPITVARVPFGGTVAANMERYGVGALNVDACRIGDTRTPTTAKDFSAWRAAEGRTDLQVADADTDTAKGRWPANVVHDGSAEVLEAFPEDAGACAPASGPCLRRRNDSLRGVFAGLDGAPAFHGDAGSAARFFYCAKASPADRDEGLEALPVGPAGGLRGNAVVSGQRLSGDGEPILTPQRRNRHPTVKPTDLMRWLCRLVVPRGGVVLDPFMGSGSTGKAAIREGMGFVGIERDRESFETARARIAHELRQLTLAI